MSENPAPDFVLVHSPLVGPFTWAMVADELRRNGYRAVVPALVSSEKIGGLYWQAHARLAASALRSLHSETPVIFVAHSGAGPLLPAIRQYSRNPVSGYIFVDAGLPDNGKSRLDLFYDLEAAGQFRQAAKNGLLSVWTEDDLRQVIPDDDVRRRFAKELSPLPLEVYEEPLPVFEGWPDAPCAYLRFGSNPSYDQSFAQAQQAVFETVQIDGQHFHMLVNPPEVARRLIDLASRMDSTK